jgi:acyl-CoA thioester hydrolase
MTEVDPTLAIETIVPIRWSDMDAYGHINHVVYLTYLEEARDAALTHILATTPGETGYVVAHLAIDYRHEMRHTDGPAVVACQVTSLGRASIQMRESIRSAAGELMTESEAVIVKFNRETRQSEPWNEAEREAFLRAGAVERTRTER